jgi:hypothetical protein
MDATFPWLDEIGVLVYQNADGCCRIDRDRLDDALARLGIRHQFWSEYGRRKGEVFPSDAETVLRRILG